MNKKEPDLITVIITTYNRKTMLQKAIESVVNQTYRNLEIIIADNHSEDGTKEMCEEFAKKDSRIVYLRHEKNLGMTGNINAAHKISKGVYMNVLCDDDWLDLDFIEKCYKEITKKPYYSFVTPTVRLFDEKYNFIKESPVVNLDVKSIYKRVCTYIYADSKNYLITNGLLKNSVTKDLLKEDDYAIKDRYAEDWVYMVKYLIAGRCKVMDSTHYNKLNNGITAKIETMHEFWNINGVNEQNWFEKVKETIINAINSDNFFKNRLTEKEREKLSQKVKTVTPYAYTDKIEAITNKIKKTLHFIKLNYLT